MGCIPAETLNIFGAEKLADWLFPKENTLSPKFFYPHPDGRLKRRGSGGYKRTNPVGRSIFRPPAAAPRARFLLAGVTGQWALWTAQDSPGYRTTSRKSFGLGSSRVLHMVRRFYHTESFHRLLIKISQGNP
jgi:hypothetical protein